MSILNIRTKHFNHEFYNFVTGFPASYNRALACNNFPYVFDRLQSNKTKSIRTMEQINATDGAGTYGIILPIWRKLLYMFAATY